MSTLAAYLDSLATVLLDQALDASWLFVLVLIVSRFIRHDAVVHTLWLVVFLKLLTPPLYELTVPLPELALPELALPAQETTLPSELTASALDAPVNAALPISLGNRESAASAKKIAFDPLPWIGLFFLIGTSSLAFLGFRRATRFRQLLQAATEPPAALLSRLEALARDLELERLPRVRIIGARLSPMLWSGWRRTELLLPSTLLARLESAELDAVLAHELAHLKRRDHWVRGLEVITLALFWWYPPLKMMRNRLHRAEERACDVWVQQLLPGAGRAYAGALVKTLDFLNPRAGRVPALACAMQPQQDWKERLTMIVTRQTARPLSAWQRGLMAAGAVLLLSIVPTLATAGGDEVPNDELEQAHQRLEEQRDALERQHQDLQRQQLAIEEQMMKLREQRIALEAQRVEAESRFQAAALEAEAVRLEAQGQQKEAERVRRDLERLNEEVALAERHLRLEREHHARRDAAELALRRSHLELEEVRRQGDPERARQLERVLETRHQELERQVQAEVAEQVALERARLEAARARAQELREHGEEELAAVAAAKLAELERVEAELAARESEIEAKIEAEIKARQREQAEHMAAEAARLEEQLDALRARRDAASGDEQEAIVAEIEQLEERLDRLHP